MMHYFESSKNIMGLMITFVMALTMVSCEEEALNCDELIIASAFDETTGSYSFTLNDIEITEISWTVDGDAVQSNSGTNLSFRLLPGTHEVCVGAVLTSCGETVEVCSILEVPETCTETEFGFSRDEQNQYTFELFGEGVTSIQWKIGEEIINNTDQVFTQKLTPGELEVCVDITFESCPSGVSFCQVVLVPEICPEITFSKSANDTGGYTFEFDREDFTSIMWSVDGDTLSDGDKNFSPALQAGTYEVCVHATFEDCPTGVNYCETITVEDENADGCLDLFFNYTESDAATNTYLFIADFVGIENLEWYGWYIDDQPIEDEGTINNGDNQLQYSFQQAGTYKVCILTETPECPAGTQYCQEITID